MSERIRLNEDEKRSTAIRIIHDADLLKHGAAVDADAGLSVDSELQAELYRKHVLEPKLPKFLEEVPEGQIISGHIETAQRLHTAINLALGHNQEFDPHDIPKMDDFRDDAVVLNIDFRRLKGKGGQNYLEELHMRDYETPLYDLAFGLMDAPQFGLGRPVSVLRSGSRRQPGQLEAGWEVSDILLDGRLEVSREGSKRGQELVKPVALDRLEQWNATSTPTQA